MSRSAGNRDTLYEQVLEHARREIDDASAKIDELKRSMSLLEARVEAAKSVYEAVAARLNLEDEGNLSEATYPDVPPRLEELEPGDEADDVPGASELLETSPAEAAGPSEPEADEGVDAVPVTGEMASENDAENGSSQPAPAGDGNDVSMALIREHLDERARRNQSELHVTPRPDPAPQVEPEDEDDEAGGDGSRTVGFPGLSEADRRLIEEHMRRRAEANQDR